MRSLLVSSLAIAGTLSGLAPKFSQQSHTFSFTTVAFAQSVANEEIDKFAVAVLQIETLRQQVAQELGSSAIAGVACNNPKSLSSLSAAARAKVETFCDDVKTIITSNGLTVPRYNEIRKLYDQDASIKQKIDRAVKRLQ